MSKCAICATQKKWLPQCDECLEHFCQSHMKEMDGGYILCPNCIAENSGGGSRG